MSMIFNKLLAYMFNFTGDWGIAIILLTIAVKIVLLPISIKQKKSLSRQQELSKKLEEIKTKYKKDKEKLEKEIKKYYEESAKSTLGCFVSLLQLPIISSLYFTIINLPVEVGTIIVPWITNIKLPDKYFIVPIIYLLTTLVPNLIPKMPFFKVKGESNINKSSVIMTGVFSILIISRAPVGVGIYFITSSIFSFIEEIIYKLYLKNKCLA